MTLTKTQKIVATVGGGVVGGVLGFVLTQHGTSRERVLTAILSATAGVGLVQTGINLATTME